MVVETVAAEPSAVAPTVSASAGMSPWVIPPGTHTFNAPLVIKDLDGVTWRGFGGSNVTRLVYTGPPTPGFIQLIGCSRCRLSDFEIVIASPGVDAAVLVTNAAAPVRVSTSNVFENIRVMHGGKPTAARRGFSIDSYAAGGVDANNDHHQFFRCGAYSHTEAGFYIRGSQCHDLIFNGCQSHDHGGRKPIGLHAQEGVFFAWRDGGMNSNSIDFRLGAAEVRTVIDGHNSESSQQFIVYPSASGMPFVNAANVRWEGQPVAGKPVVDVGGPGPWSFRNMLVSGINGVCPTIRISGGEGSADLSGITIRQHGGTMPTGAIVTVPVGFETRAHGLRYQQIPATGGRVNRRVAVNQAMVTQPAGN